MLGCALRPIGVSSVAMWFTKNQKKVSKTLAIRSSGRNGILPTLRPQSTVE